MATSKAAIQHHSITAQFTDEEYELLEAFAAEQGIDELEQAVPAMIHELIRLHDALWDKQLENLPEALIEMGKEALEEYEAGQTEDIDTDAP